MFVNSRTRSDSGFTLIELISVIGILAILSASFLYYAKEAKLRAYNAEAQAANREIVKALLALAPEVKEEVGVLVAPNTSWIKLPGSASPSLTSVPPIPNVTSIESFYKSSPEIGYMALMYLQGKTIPDYVVLTWHCKGDKTFGFQDMLKWNPRTNYPEYTKRRFTSAKMQMGTCV